MDTPSGYSSLATSIYSTTGPSSPTTQVSAADRQAKWRFSTLCTTVDVSKNQHGASATPIFQTATFKGPPGAQYDYTRSGNPTRGGLETHLARLYNCSHAFAVSTGMTALDLILRLVKPNEVVLAGDDLYGGTNRLLGYLTTHGGVNVVHVDTTKMDAVEMALKEHGDRISMVLLESPTNPLLKIADIEEISKRVKATAPNALVVVDNTMMSPYLQQPLRLGADIVYDSGTKYLSGHHDLMAGTVAVARDDVAKQLGFLINSVGTGLAPFDSFLLLRGLKTLSLRLDRQSATTTLVAAYLDALKFKVNFPGLPSHPMRDIHWKQATGAGAVLSFETEDKELSERIVGSARLWGISVSFGAVNSLISMPCLMSHASISAALRKERGLPEDLIRLCVGIEDPRDLLDDLEHALVSAGAITHKITGYKSPTIPLEQLYDQDPQQWALERAAGFERYTPPSNSSELEDDILVSAPGKVILFGEHAVVHGVTAIAASVNLRCYGLLSGRSDPVVGLELGDIGFSAEWPIEVLPWAKVAGATSTELHAPLIDALETLVDDGELQDPAKDETRSKAAAVAFLYLYIIVAGSLDEALGVTFCARSALPIGAGLGSSASFSVCIASALLAKFGKVNTDAVSSEHENLVDAHAFLAEKVMHGNPSGIDNAVATRGGAVVFARAMAGNDGRLESVTGFKSIRLLLTDSRIPRDTKKLVAGVSALKLAEPELVNGILESIESISNDAHGSLADVTLERTELITRLERMIDENHGHLVSLGVSHPALEAIRAKTALEPFGLKTKLTGAGGGGCAVTLIPDDFAEESLNALVSDLSSSGFHPYLTSVGGSGMGLHRPLAAKDVDAEGGDETFHVSLRMAFSGIPKEQLEEWGTSQGSWAFRH